MNDTDLVIILIVACVAGILLIFCCARSIIKEKKELLNATKQVQQVDEDEDLAKDIESMPPSEDDIGRQSPPRDNVLLPRGSAVRHGGDMEVQLR